MPLPAQITENTCNQFSSTIAPDFASVRKTLACIDGWLRDYDVKSDSRDNVQLVLAEVLNNIIEHAALGGSQDIDLSLSLASEDIECQIHDLGRPIRVLLHRSNYEFSEDTQIADLPEGGFGLFLVQSIARNIRYLPINQGNHLALSVPLITNSEQIY